MNEYQVNYVNAKALYETLNEQFRAEERNYVAGLALGSDVIYIDDIEDDALFAEHNRKFTDTCRNNGSEAELNEARTALYAAEDALINYGLSVVPAEHRATINEGRRMVTFRQRIIDMIMKLQAPVSV